jgi:hypothetical protein
MPMVALSAPQKKRVRSILKQHALLFGSGIVVDDPGVEAESAELISGLDALDERQAARVASIVRQHALLFGKGMVLGEKPADREDDRLVRALVAPRGDSSAPAGVRIAGARTGTVYSRRASRTDSGTPRAVQTGPDALRAYRLFGKGRRTSIPQSSGMLALWCHPAGSLGAACLLIPRWSVARHRVESEPVQFWLSGEAHIVLMEPRTQVASSAPHDEWPAAIGPPPPPDMLLTVRTNEKDRICLGMRPHAIPGSCHIVASAEEGMESYYFPANEGLFLGLVSFLANAFQAGVDVARSDAEGIAYFAVKRVLQRS